MKDDGSRMGSKSPIGRTFDMSPLRMGGSMTPPPALAGRSPFLSRTGALPADTPADEAGASALLIAAIERVPFALTIVDAGGTVATANEPARRILARRDGISTVGGVLEAHVPAETRQLRMTIRETMLKPESAWPAHDILTLSRPSGRQPFILLVRPLSKCTTSCLATRGRAMVLINDLEWPSSGCGYLLRQTFGLTIAEAEVATSLMDGHEPRQIAERRGVRVSTIRTQIRSILAKCRVGRQIDLVKLIARLPGVTFL